MMRSSGWPILLGIIALVAGAVWFDATHTATDAQAQTAVASH